MSRTLLIWDAPNMDMALATAVGRQPHPGERPRFDAVGRWLVEQAGAEDEVEACVFTNVAEGSAARIAGWVKTLRQIGYSVFVKPKTGTSDVDADMLAHLAARQAEGDLARVFVASGDGRAFLEPLQGLAAGGTSVGVLAFAEEATYAVTADALTFTDLEDVPGAFLEPLPRTRLDALPPEGRWLAPLGSLRRLAA